MFRCCKGGKGRTGGKGGKGGKGWGNWGKGGKGGKGSAKGSKGKGTNMVVRQPSAPARVIFTEFVVDRSGSMSSMSGNQYDGANKFLADQQEAARDTGASGYISFTTFDSSAEVRLDTVQMDSLQLPARNMPDMLKPRGGTRLIDTMCERLTELRGNMRECRNQLARTHDGLPKTQRGVFAVLTDGKDNRSSQSAADFQRLLAEVQAEFKDVTVLFLGANIDAVSTGASFGVSAEYSMNIAASGRSSAAAFTSMSSAASRAARGGRHHGGFTPSERHTSAPPSRHPPQGGRFGSGGGGFGSNAGSGGRGHHRRP